MSIRPIAVVDIDELSQLYVDAFAEPPWNERWEIGWARDRLSSIMAMPGFVGFGEMLDGSLVSAAIGRTLPYKGRTDFDLMEFFVAPHCQARGLGGRLLHCLESHLVEAGIGCTSLLTTRDSVPAKFYAKHGYRVHEHMGFMSKYL